MNEYVCVNKKSYIYKGYLNVIYVYINGISNVKMEIKNIHLLVSHIYFYY